MFVDGERREIENFNTGDEPLNVFLILDTSPSAAVEIKSVRHFAAQFVESLRPSDNVQIIQFNEKTSVLSPLTNDRQVLSRAVRRLDIGDGTSIHDSLSTIMQKHISPVAGRKIVILLTDGVDTSSASLTYETSLAEAEKVDAAIYPFYVDTFKFWTKNTVRAVPGSVLGTILGSIVNNPAATKSGAITTKEAYELGRNYLNDAARLSGGRTFEVKNPERVDKAELAGIRELFTPKYFVGFKVAASDSPEKRRQIKVRINQPNLTVRARGSYILKTNP